MLLAVSMTVPFAVGHAIAGRKLLVVPRDAAALVAVAVLCQLAVTGLPLGSSRLLLPVSFALGAAALHRVLATSSRDRSVTWTGTLGAALNLLPIAVHGAMPVAAKSRSMVATDQLMEPALIAAKHMEVEQLSFPVGLAADWIPLPGLGAVVSPGDVLLIAAIVMLGLRRRRGVNEIRTETELGRPGGCPVAFGSSNNEAIRLAGAGQHE